MGLRFSELDDWRRWQARRRPLRVAKDALLRATRPGQRLSATLTRAGPEPRLLVVTDARSPSHDAALLAPLDWLPPEEVAVISSRPVRDALPEASWLEEHISPESIVDGYPSVRAVYAVGNFLPLSRAVYEALRGRGTRFLVGQHGVLTPYAPPLPQGCDLLAWTDADSEFWCAARPDVTSHVVGSPLLERAASEGSTGEGAEMVFLGQLHGAELPRRQLAVAAEQFCRSTGATYRPHPSERDRTSRQLLSLVGRGPS